MINAATLYLPNFFTNLFISASSLFQVAKASSGLDTPDWLSSKSCRWRPLFAQGCTALNTDSGIVLVLFPALTIEHGFLTSSSLLNCMTSIPRLTTCCLGTLVPILEAGSAWMQKKSVVFRPSLKSGTRRIMTCTGSLLVFVGAGEAWLD
jgi:hypothetical protein